MSSKTNFKRIALVAVAALGLGVLSSAPSQAAITGVLAVTNTNGTATTSLADSTTAGSIKVRWLATATADTVGFTASLNTKPTDSGANNMNLYPSDTATSVSAATLKVNTGITRTVAQATGGDTAVVSAVAAGYASGTFLYQLGNTPNKAGTYTFTLTITPYGADGQAETTKVVTQDVSIVVSVPAASSTTAASPFSTATLVTGTTVDSVTAASTSVALLATASATARASVWVKLRNASNGAVETLDSLTVTIDKGNIGSSSSAALGKSVIINYAPSAPAGGVAVYVFSDGSPGKATITIATKNAGTFTKTLDWYGADAAKITASAARSVIGVGAESTLGAVSGNAQDANNISFGAATAIYAYSSDTSVISNFGTACTWNSTLEKSYCALTGVKAGTATITLRDASTVALSTVASSAVSVRVSQGVATSFTLKTDKATYAPGEKGYVWVTVLDAAGLAMPVQASTTSTLASGGISVSAQLGNSSDTLTATAFATEASATPASLDPVKAYTFYAPVSGGAFTFSAKGASTFSAASQTTATTVAATVTDNGAAALAAVNALATTVASLKTLITTLTNLVLKIQKKVKA